MLETKTTPRPKALGFIGFGEAGMAFATGLAEENHIKCSAFDLKTEGGPDERQKKQLEYLHTGVCGVKSAAECASEAQAVFSLVTADQAVQAAISVAKGITQGSYYFDGNSCAPDTKRKAAAVIQAAGGRYVDMAIMGPVGLEQHKTPVLISSEWADEALAVMKSLGMHARHASGGVGAAASIKLIRSVMIKGMEALVAECFLSAHKAGVTEEVLASLEISYPDFNWQTRAGYMLERMVKHGPRRAAEMREAALCVDQLGLNNGMSAAAVIWQQRIGDLALEPSNSDFQAQAEAILAAMAPLDKPEEHT